MQIIIEEEVEDKNIENIINEIEKQKKSLTQTIRFLTKFVEHKFRDNKHFIKNKIKQIDLCFKNIIHIYNEKRTYAFTNSDKIIFNQIKNQIMKFKEMKSLRKLLCNDYDVIINFFSLKLNSLDEILNSMIDFSNYNEIMWNLNVMKIYIDQLETEIIIKQPHLEIDIDKQKYNLNLITKYENQLKELNELSKMFI